MELAIRMKTLTRALLFVATLLLWLVLLAFLNGQVFFVEDLLVVSLAPLLALATTFVVARALHT